MTNIIVDAVKAMGGTGAEWQVQAIGAGAFFLAAAGCGVLEWWRRKRKERKK